jgi:hypothetical protein
MRSHSAVGKSELNSVIQHCRKNTIGLTELSGRVQSSARKTENSDRDLSNPKEDLKAALSVNIGSHLNACLATRYRPRRHWRDLP